jgi:hypothetical protein
MYLAVLLTVGNNYKKRKEFYKTILLQAVILFLNFQYIFKITVLQSNINQEGFILLSQNLTVAVV